MSLRRLQWTSFRTAQMLAVALAAVAVSCGPRDLARKSLGGVRVVPLPNPSGPGAMGPNLAMTDQGPVLSWLEPSVTFDSGAEKAQDRWKLQVSRWSNNAFQSPTTAAEGDGFFANWADFPALAVHPSGTLFVHHLAKLGLGTYAYGAFLAASTDQAWANWSDLGLLHDDASLTEHGFASYTRTSNSGEQAQIRAFWLDGRNMAIDGPMSLRSTVLEAHRDVRAATAGVELADITVHPPGKSIELDDRVCECCQTDAATTSQGPIVVYRNRSEDEIRDIYAVRQVDAGWSTPAAVHKDGWKIEGCPVNGPAVAAEGDVVAVAWFTAADNQPRVKLAVSRDAGASFSAPVLIQDGHTAGRVDVALTTSSLGTEIWITHLSHIAHDSTQAEPEGQDMVVALDHLRLTAKGVERGSTYEVAGSNESRSAGFPRIVPFGQDLTVTWVDSTEPSVVRTAMVSTRLED